MFASGNPIWKDLQLAKACDGSYTAKIESNAGSALLDAI
jgi:hypothetical protein